MLKKQFQDVSPKHPTKKCVQNKPTLYNSDSQKSRCCFLRLHTDSLPCLCSRKLIFPTASPKRPCPLASCWERSWNVSIALHCPPHALLWFWWSLHLSWATGTVKWPLSTVQFSKALITPSLSCPCRPKDHNDFILFLVLGASSPLWIPLI